jgi:hypothetical protein
MMHQPRSRRALLLALQRAGTARRLDRREVAVLHAIVRCLPTTGRLRRAEPVLVREVRSTARTFLGRLTLAELAGSLAGLADAGWLGQGSLVPGLDRWLPDDVVMWLVLQVPSVR